MTLPEIIDAIETMTDDFAAIGSSDGALKLSGALRRLAEATKWRASAIDNRLDGLTDVAGILEEEAEKCFAQARQI